MVRLLLSWIVACTVVSADESSGNTTVLGANPDLVEGYHAMLSGQFDEAVEKFEAGLKLTVTRRDRAKALSNLCAGYIMLHEYPKAVASCSKSLEISQSNWHALNNRALALMGMNKLEEAATDVSAALVLRPTATKLLRTQEILLGKQRKPRVTIEDNS